MHSSFYIVSISIRLSLVHQNVAALAAGASGTVMQRLSTTPVYALLQIAYASTSPRPIRE